MRTFLRTVAAAGALLALILPASAAGHRKHSTAHHAAPAPAASASQQVWVNLDTGVYHYPGERWYGKTKNGKYMSEDAAKAAGYRASSQAG